MRFVTGTAQTSSAWPTARAEVWRPRGLGPRPLGAAQTEVLMPTAASVARSSLCLAPGSERIAAFTEGPRGDDPGGRGSHLLGGHAECQAIIVLVLRTSIGSLF